MNSILPSLDMLVGAAPANLAAGATTGIRIKVDDCDRVAIVLFKGIGADGEDPTVTVLQHDAPAAGNSKALNFTEVWTKQGAAGGAAPAAWTKVTQAAGNTYTNTDAGQNIAIWVIEVDVEDLDRTGGYYWLSANVNDVGDTAQSAGVLYLKGGLRLAQ